MLKGKIEDNATTGEPKEAESRPLIYLESTPQLLDSLKQELHSNPIDPHSYAQTDHVKVTNLDLALLVDFCKYQLSGHVDLEYEKLSSEIKYLNLDTDKLNISSVKGLNHSQWIDLSYHVYPSVLDLGSKLCINIEKMSSKGKIKVEYITEPRPRAFVWLSETQTSSRKVMMFSENVPVGARSWLPCQDTPSVKATFSATIEAPSDLVVLMGATRETSTSDLPMKSTANSNTTFHHFKQRTSISTYFVSIAIGSFTETELANQTRLFCEEKYKAKAVALLQDIIVKIFQKLDLLGFGSYLFPAFDLLILPPSFSCGGMENPCLTFVSNSALKDSDQAANILTHELAHSWFGNTITTQNWANLWLNEGFATFYGRKMLSLMDLNEVRYAEERLGWYMFQSELKNVKKTHFCLVPNLRDCHPGQFSKSTFSYENGYYLLKHLEDVLGEQNFAVFIAEYIKRFKPNSISTSDFINFFDDYQKKNPKVNQTRIDWDRWTKSQNMNQLKPEFSITPQMKKSISLAELWSSLKDSELKQKNIESKLHEYTTFSNRQKKLFLIELKYQTGDQRLSELKMERLTELYKLEKERTSLRKEWIFIGLFSHWKGIVPAAKHFLAKHGHSRSLSIEIYGAMRYCPETVDFARETFKAKRELMGVYSGEEIDEILK